MGDVPVKILVAVEILADENGQCDEDCSVCCNQAGDREWAMKVSTGSHGYDCEDHRGPQCLAAEKRMTLEDGLSLDELLED